MGTAQSCWLCILSISGYWSRVWGEKGVCEWEREWETMREGGSIRSLERRRRLSEEVPTASV